MFLRIVVSVMFLLVWTTTVAQAQQLMKDVIGANHIGGRYELYWSYDYLNEGADEIRALGSNVIKIWFHNNATSWYANQFNPPDRQWTWINPNMEYKWQLVLAARMQNYKDLFNRPLKTYVMIVMPAGAIVGTGRVYEPEFINGMTAAEITAEREAMYELTRELMTTYANTGKTFVLQNHEGDWLLRHHPLRDPSNPAYDPSAPEMIPSGTWPSEVAINGMRDWLAARQAGVEQARTALASAYPNVTVLHATEVNRVTDARNGSWAKSVTNDVLPCSPGKTCARTDLYSYSVWDVNFNADTFRLNLDYLASKTPGADDIYIGEYGAGENTDAGGSGEQQKVLIERMTNVALDFGARYILYWNVFCNGKRTPTSPFPAQTNSDVVGFWLRRVDGSYTPVWSYLRSLVMNSTRRRAVQH
ncbi:MAG: hypothetical protein ACXW5U_15660 [Thermoanaerobaculia bacterium]